MSLDRVLIFRGTRFFAIYGAEWASDHLMFGRSGRLGGRIMMRTFVVAMMLASASSFAPSPKTQLATRRPAQAPPRVMPAMKLTPGNPLYYIGFPSQCQKDDEIREVCPYHCALLWSPIASLELLASLDSCAPGAPRLPGAPSPP